MSEVTLVPEPKLDEVRLFMLFVLFGGDCKRVAAVSQTDIKRIESLAHDFQWKNKVGGRKGLSTVEGQEDERALNRATNFVTAERLKRVFGTLIDELDSDPAFVKSFCTDIDSETGERSFNTKNLVELAKGLQICNDITYRALQDKQAQAAEIVSGASDPATLALRTYAALTRRFDKNLSIDTAAVVVEAVTDARTPTTETKVG